MSKHRNNYYNDVIISGRRTDTGTSDGQECEVMKLNCDSGSRRSFDSNTLNALD